MYGLVLEYTKKNDRSFGDIDEWLNRNSEDRKYMYIWDSADSSPVLSAVAIYVDDKDTYTKLLAWMVDRFSDFHPMIAISDVYAQIGARDRKSMRNFTDYSRAVWMGELSMLRKMGTVSQALDATAN